MVQIIECPRDAMQGIKTFIPTDEKVAYLRRLLKVGFHTLDFGSFVSPKAVPQMQDTAEVLKAIESEKGSTRLLAIIANPRGAEDAVKYASIDYLGYPFSISETFQQRNTNRGIAEAFEDVKVIQELCRVNGKELVVYISMGFGNPYNDPWSADVALEWVDKLEKEGVKIFSLSDTVGTALTEDITYIFNSLLSSKPHLQFGAHFHSRPEGQKEKIGAAYEAGCRRFDVAMLGYGGCPMAKDDLTGNMSTEALVTYLKEKGEASGLSDVEYGTAREMASNLFGTYR